MGNVPIHPAIINSDYYTKLIPNDVITSAREPQHKGSGNFGRHNNISVKTGAKLRNPGQLASGRKNGLPLLRLPITGMAVEAVSGQKSRCVIKRDCPN